MDKKKTQKNRLALLIFTDQRKGDRDSSRNCSKAKLTPHPTSSDQRVSTIPHWVWSPGRTDTVKLFRPAPKFLPYRMVVDPSELKAGRSRAPR